MFLVNWISTIGIFLAISIHHYGHVIAQDETITGLLDHSVVLTCPIDKATCGELHSLRWFRGSDRMAAISGDKKVTNVDEKYVNRITVDQQETVNRLEIKSAKIEDEAIYKCDTTFVQPLDTCSTSSGYRINLKINVKPEKIQVLDAEDKPIANHQIVGPVREGHTFRATCEVTKTRPSPQVTWYKNGTKLTTHRKTDESDGLVTVKSELALPLTRQELYASFECRVESEALDEPVTNDFTLDLQVRPTKVDIKGVKDHTVDGSTVTLTCEVSSARPAANVTWYNGSTPIDPNAKEPTEIITTTRENSDGTIDTLSKLVFVATRYDNEKLFRCEADNNVIRASGEKSLIDIEELLVMYPPVIHVKPDNVSVNEGYGVVLFCDYQCNPMSLTDIRWLKDGVAVDVSNTRFKGGTLNQTSLEIDKASRMDAGVYKCELTNMVGMGLSENQVDLDVQFVPSVELIMEPDHPVIENDEANVTLYCNVLEGNPSSLQKVRWVLEGNLLKELPDCKPNSSPEGEDLCNIDPSKLLLQNIGREFFGNYSCEGYNSAGWGPRSAENDLVVYYEPGNATLKHYPLVPAKRDRSNVTLTCSVDDVGFPNAAKFRWYRGGQPIMNSADPVYEIVEVGLHDRTNFSCLAFNEGGDGNNATIYLDIHAPPKFISKMPQYSGALATATQVELNCRVECYPRCTISWAIDDHRIDVNSRRYKIIEKYLEPDPATGDFESVLSKLVFQMDSWPGGKFDIFEDSSHNYSCTSSSNQVGPAVAAVTHLNIEYPPERTNITAKRIEVVEDHILQDVLCEAFGNPRPRYYWFHSGESVCNESRSLDLKAPMKQSHAGTYTCFAINKHGSDTADLIVDILYKPICEIKRKEIKDEDTLICTAEGNPDQLDFAWSIRNDNQSNTLLNIRPKGKASHLILTDDFSITQTYVCTVTNRVGSGVPCEYEVAGRLPWYQRWDRTTIIILVASIIVVILGAIALCIIIICVCRRKRREKYHTDVSICATQSVLSYQASSPLPSASLQSAPEIPKSPPKWPLRPGVMVHVKGDTKQNLCANRNNISVISPPPTSSTSSSCTNVLPTELTIAKTSAHEVIASTATTSEGVGITLPPPPPSVQTATSSSPQKTLFSYNNEVSKYDMSSYSTMKPLPLPSRTRKSLAFNQQMTSSPVVLTNCSIDGGRNPMFRISIENNSNVNNNNVIESQRSGQLPPPPIPPKKSAAILASINSTNRNNCSGNSANELLPRKGRRKRGQSTAAVAAITSQNAGSSSDEDDDDDNNSSFGCRPLQDAENSASGPGVGCSTGNSGGGLFEKIFGEIFNKQRNSDCERANSSRKDAINSKSGGSSSERFRQEFRNLFGMSRVFGRQRLERSDSGASNPFATGHRLKGIRCSAGVVTYKKTPILQRTTMIDSNSNALLASDLSDPTKKPPDKSSALADPLTEPGEYENLPFHGLQTAPNKFGTAPINFNSSNVVRVAPQPKLLINNNQQHQTHQYHQQETLLLKQQQNQQQYKLQSHNTLNNHSGKHPFSMSTTSSHQNHLTSSGIPPPPGSVGYSTVGSASNNSFNGNVTHNQTNYDLSNCFPTSYTAYYQQQQCSGFDGKNLQPYTVEKSNSSVGNSLALKNPFLANNFKKFNTNSGCRQGVHRKKSSDSDKKFYSLKSLGNKKSLHFCSMKPPFGTSLSSSDKCKRHHSFTGGSVGDIVTASQTLPYISQTHSKMKFYEPPLYENLTDSIQIHESSMLGIGAGGGGGVGERELSQQHHSYHQQKHHKHQHHQHQHQKIDDYNNLVEAERLRIYRSDSGISNSSYECVTPVPAPRQQLLSKSHNSLAMCQSNGPVYMNLSSESAAMATGSSHNPSSSSHLNPLSQSKYSSSGHNNSVNCNSLSSSNNNRDNITGNSCNNHLHNGAATNSSKKSNNNASSSSYSTSLQKAAKHHQHGHHHHQKPSSNRKCKKRVTAATVTASATQPGDVILTNDELSPNTNNPFTVNSTSSSGAVNGNRIQINGSLSDHQSPSSTLAGVRCRHRGGDLQPHQHQPLHPKELFPMCSSSLSHSNNGIVTNSLTKSTTNNSIDAKDRQPNDPSNTNYNYNSDNSLSAKETTSQKAKGYSSASRPIKLPLRKHHSFHFQSSQTVAGAKANQKPHPIPNYKQNGGPLIFKPFFNENNAFKPITPVMTSNRIGSNSNLLINPATAPRICGTSLKRHMSNVESYDSTRYGNSISSPKLNINDEEDDDSDEEIDEIIITQEAATDAASSSSNSTIIGNQGKRLHYADLASLSPAKGRNYLPSSNRNACDDFDDLTINSDNEQLRRSGRSRQPFCDNEFRSNERNFDSDTNTVVVTPTKRTTQYATLKFNEPSKDSEDIQKGSDTYIY